MNNELLNKAILTMGAKMDIFVLLVTIFTMLCILFFVVSCNCYKTLCSIKYVVL